MPSRLGPRNSFRSLVQALSLWAVALLLVAGSLAAVEGGVILGRRQARKHAAGAAESPAKSNVEGYIISSIFGLLAFLVGFTFSMSLSRYDDRRSWIAQEATAISTVYLRAELLDEPYRSRLRSLLRDYATSRLAPDNITSAEIETGILQTERIRNQLWDETRTAIYPDRKSDLASYFVEAMNNALDIGTRRALAGRAHVPTQIVAILLVYLLVAAIMLGYLMAKEGTTRRHESTLLILMFVASINLILDLDRPREGLIRVSQRPLEELIASMNADAAKESVTERPSKPPTADEHEA